MKTLLTILSMFYSAYLQVQTTLKGTLTDHKGEAIAVAHIYMKDIYDDASSELHYDIEF